MTERIYDTDSHAVCFDARVCSCTQTAEGWETVLDATAFFPGGGGQKADSGTLNGVRVLSVYERGDDVVHLLPEPVSGTVQGCIDWTERFDRMQAHSGEHIVSGVIHAMYGYDNVGFHMGADGVVIDFDGYIDASGVAEAERRVNEIITRNVPVTVSYPDAETLAAMHYRSKKELTGRVRIVTIEGVDRCACCAPHVQRTGEVGLVKLLDCVKHKNGVRMTMLSGRAALADYTMKCAQMDRAGALLSAKPENVANAVEKLKADMETLNRQNAAMRRQLAQTAADALTETEGNLCLFFPEFDAEQLRLVVTAGMERCTGVCAAFGGEEGHYQYIIGSRSTDLRRWAKEINARIGGRGGGKPEMLQGSAGGTQAEISAFFAGSSFKN